MRSFFDRTTLIFGAALVVLGAVGLYSYEYTLQSLQAFQRRADTRQNLIVIDAVQSLLIEAQTGQRGFLLTGLTRDLQPYHQAISAIDGQFAELTSRLGHKPEQIRRISELKHLTQTILAAMEDGIGFREKRGISGAVQFMKSDPTHDAMENARRLILEIRRHEKELLDRHVVLTAQLAHTAENSMAARGIFGFILVLITMIFTRRYQAQQRKTQAERIAVEEERDRFFKLSLDMLCIAGLDGYFKRVSPAFQEILGYTPEEFCSRPILDFVHPDDVAPTSRQIETQANGNSVISFENRYRCKDGTYRWLSWKSVPAENKMYAIARDVTESKKSAENLLKARLAAEEAAKAKSEFLANMSHEIRTPMNGVLGMTDLLLETKLDVHQTEYARTIRASADNLLAIINDILDFSKIEAGKLSFENMGFDLKETVESAVSLLSQQAHAKRIEYASSLDADLPLALRGDPGRLRQIILNLVSNAIKFTPDHGEVFVRVTKETETKSHATIRFEIQDTGIGIPIAVQKQLFQPFTQADTSTVRRFGGTGLGLAICRQLVQLFQGKIGVNSAPGMGSTFWFTIPFEKFSPQRNEEKLQNLPSLRGIRVLMVEDNDTQRRHLHRLISSWGLKCETCRDGAETREKLGTAFEAGTPYSVVCIDRSLPEGDGLKLAESLRQDPRFADLRIIVITSIEGLTQNEAKAAGIDAWVPKPIKQSSLFDSITASLHAPRLADKQSHSAPASILTLDAAGIKLLLAEDNPVNQRIALLQLKNLGLHADAVKNGREVMEALQHTTYDIILMDCQMAEMDGYQATREIRQLNGPAAKAVIIAMTANALEGDRETCLQAGMNDYLSKPVRIEDLRSTLKRWIERLHASRGN